MTAFILLTPPAVEPLTLSEAKTHLRVDASTEDALITTLLTVARQRCEEYTGRSLITQTWRLWLDAAGFNGLWFDGQREAPISALTPDTLALSKGPVQSVSAITSFSEADIGTVFASSNYFVDSDSVPARIQLRSGASWPSPGRSINFLRIDYVCGYGASGSAVPAALRQGMLQHLAALYEGRGEVVMTGMPAACLALYEPFRQVRL